MLDETDPSLRRALQELQQQNPQAYATLIARQENQDAFAGAPPTGGGETGLTRSLNLGGDAQVSEEAGPSPDGGLGLGNAPQAEATQGLAPEPLVGARVARETPAPEDPIDENFLQKHREKRSPFMRIADTLAGGPVDHAAQRGKRALDAKVKARAENRAAQKRQEEIEQNNAAWNIAGYDIIKSGAQRASTVDGEAQDAIWEATKHEAISKGFYDKEDIPALDASFDLLLQDPEAMQQPFLNWLGDPKSSPLDEESYASIHSLIAQGDSGETVKGINEFLGRDMVAFRNPTKDLIKFARPGTKKYKEYDKSDEWAPAKLSLDQDKLRLDQRRLRQQAESGKDEGRDNVVRRQYHGFEKASDRTLDLGGEIMSVLESNPEAAAKAMPGLMNFTNSLYAEVNSAIVAGKKVIQDERGESIPLSEAEAFGKKVAGEHLDRDMLNRIAGTPAAAQQLEAAVIAMAYAVAGTRETGRFSESDIRGALREVGNTSDPEIFKRNIQNLMGRVARNLERDFQRASSDLKDSDIERHEKRREDFSGLFSADTEGGPAANHTIASAEKTDAELMSELAELEALAAKKAQGQ